MPRPPHHLAALRPPAPKGLKPKRPGEILQIDTLFVNVRPTPTSSTLPPTIPSPNGRSDALPRGPWLNAPQPCSTSSVPKRRSPSPVSRSMAAPSSRPTSNRPAPIAVSPSTCCRKHAQLNGAVECAQGSWRYEFHAYFDLPQPGDHSPLAVADDPLAGSLIAALVKCHVGGERRCR